MRWMRKISEWFRDRYRIYFSFSWNRSEEEKKIVERKKKKKVSFTTSKCHGCCDNDCNCFAIMMWLLGCKGGLNFHENVHSSLRSCALNSKSRSFLREIWRLGFSSGRIRTSLLSLSSKETNENRIEMQQRNGKLRVVISAATITARLIVDYSFGRRPTRFHFLFLPLTCPFPILPFKQMTHGVSLTRTTLYLFSPIVA